MKDTSFLIELKEEKISYTDDSLYNITSFGTDLTFREIVSMYEEGDLEKPELQRKYVWTKNEASRFVDSVLLGLPVPSIFLAKTHDDKRLIVDGYQRIMTIYDYMKGIFSGDNKIFKLSNTENIHNNWRGKAFNELTEEQKRKIKLYPIHAIVFEQKYPKNDSGMYQIFERINNSGRTLKPQEIRNCIYYGPYNKFLLELNKEIIWRNVIGEEKEDIRMSDVELILRFFALSNIFNRNEVNQQRINLVKYLNVYMFENSSISNDEKEKQKSCFIDTMNFLYNEIGIHVFRVGIKNQDSIKWTKKINPAIFDAICSATILSKYQKEDICTSINKYEQLLLDKNFMHNCKIRTTDIENIKNRTKIAAKVLFGMDLCL